MAVALAAAVALSIAAGVEAEDYRTIKNIEFAKTGQQPLKLDLYLPDGQSEGPLVVWVHGGAWMRGSRDNVPVLYLVEKGYAVASVDYRLSPVAKFPAQVHDIKAAIRFLRAKENQFGYDASRIGIAGASAGGHLAALVGVTNGHEELEGSVGEYSGESSDVAAVVDLYGPTNFLTILAQSTPHGLSVRVPALKLLLDGHVNERPQAAGLASVTSHVDPSDPPLLILHGDQDPQVPINQSHELYGLYDDQNLDVTFEVVHGGAHGGKQFHDDERQELVVTFFNRALSKGKTSPVLDEELE
ncbi:alpha/beta hydrolase [Stratiformator vulcanicus]|nr:alpha/beta hydrolase [Stratiformator vulcanicus]